jgi:uncharacterized LabA/DUF88 family protein
MRVALFIDGQNFYSGWRDSAQGRRIDFSTMADWILKQVGGDTLWGAHYYTGIDLVTNESTENGAHKLLNFLEVLETQPGYFVHRFPRRSQRLKCTSCDEDVKYTQDRELDSGFVSDIVRYAANDSFDILVLLSANPDYTPALKAVGAMGKQTFVASWSEGSISHRIRKVVFDHVDLMSGLDTFLRAGEAEEESALAPGEPDDYENTMDTFISELRMAEEKFEGGYVGLGYFVTKWRSNQLTGSADLRRKLVEDLALDGRLELYEASDGAQAIRAL